MSPTATTHTPLARLPAIGASLLLLAAAIAWPARAADAVVDAKRRAAADLIKSGKTADGVALLQEVVTIDPTDYRDQLQLARAYEKLNRPSDAVEAYHRALELSANATGAADRAAKVEIERRLKVLDALTQKIQASEEEFLRKLDTLEREAIAAKDARAVARIFMLKGSLYRASGRADAIVCEVLPDRDWQDSGLTTKAGATYRVRAVGTVRYKSGATATPDGAPGQKGGYPEIPLGALIGRVDGGAAAYIKVGSNGEVAADQPGRLRFRSNSGKDEWPGAGGSFVVLVERVDR